MHSSRMRMLWLSIICLTSVVDIHGASADRFKEFLSKTLPALCPFSTFCTVGHSNTIVSEMFDHCCKPCSCTDDCLDIGNCCPDFPAVLNASTPIIPRSKCTLPVVDGIVEDHVLPDSLNDWPSYYTISECPEGYNDPDVVSKCINPKALDQKERVIVSDERGQAFNNRYCAECNGVHTYMEWGLQLFCRGTSEQLMDAVSQQDLDGTDCLLLSSPPTPDVASTSQCFLDSIDSCNVTGNWDMYDANVVKACRSTTFPYLAESTTTRQVYRNPFCYLCNKNHTGADISRHCDLQKSWRPGLTSYVSVLVDNDTFRRPTHTTRCDLSSVFDPHFDECRVLHCPVGLRPFYGKCVQDFKQMTGVPIYAQIEALFADDETRRLFDIPRKAAFPIIADHIKNGLEMVFEPLSCGTCLLHVLLAGDDRGIAFLFGYKTTITCTPAALIDSLNTWRTGIANISVTIGSQNATFHLQMAHDLNMQSLPKALFGPYKQWVMFGNSDTVSCNQATFLDHLFYCPSIELSAHEYWHVLSQNTPLRMSDFKEVHSDMEARARNESFYRICVDRYMESTTTTTAAMTTATINNNSNIITNNNNNINNNNTNSCGALSPCIVLQYIVEAVALWINSRGWLNRP